MDDKNILLGDSVRDTVTGFVGIATARAKYLNSVEPRIKVEGLDKKNGLPVEFWFDENRLTPTS